MSQDDQSHQPTTQVPQLRPVEDTETRRLRLQKLEQLLPHLDENQLGEVLACAEKQLGV